MAITLAQIMEVHDRVMRETPVPETESWLGHFLGIPRRSYRQRLDAPPVNIYGHPLTRRQVVEHNLQRYPNPRLDPARLR